MSVGLDAIPALLAALTESVARAAAVDTAAPVRDATDGRAGAPATELPCVTAEAYLGTTLYELEESVDLEIAGNGGEVTVSFLSGTSLSAVVASIETNTATTGVSAAQATENPTRIELRSVNAGSDQFVSVRQVPPGERTPIVFATEHDENALFEHEDYGEDAPPGDVDCDLRVGMTDLIAVMRAWGMCTACPEDVNGDGVVDGLDVTLVLERWDRS